MFEDELLAAAGGLRGAYDDVDWAATPVGAMATWSPALRNAADVALHTQFPVTLLWGPEFVLIYNEAYVPLIADKHPAALGSRARDVFPEAWDTVGPMMRSVLAGGAATWVEDEYVPLQRRGRLEEAYFTFSYSPVRTAGGPVEGVMDIAAETTQRVIDRRRLVTLVRLRELLASLDRVGEIPERALPLLRANPHDLPGVGIRPADGRPAREAVGGGRARFPLGAARVDGGQLVLDVRLSEHLSPDGSYLAFLRLVASSLGDALDRIRAHEAERGIAEAMQRTLLTSPRAPEQLEVAVRYLPAAQLAQIGGDWYDAFLGPRGRLELVVGDVAGHDKQAAAAMAEVRNLLRGVSYTLGAPPSGVLTALDGAMLGLALGVYVTAILAHVEQDAQGDRTLRWSNAGHPPPVLVEPGGAARLLETPPDVLLGLGRDGARSDHVVALAPGSVVVFYTDGLIERRAVPLTQRLDWLVGLLAGADRLSAEEICDRLVGALDDAVEDDIALLVVRVSSA